MDWKREAADMLRSYEAMRVSLSALPEERKRLELEAAALKGSLGGGEPVVGGHGGREDRLISNLMKREAVQRNLELARKHVDLVDMALAVLDEEERLVLDRFYIHRAKGNVDRLCGELNLEKAAVYRRRDAALRHFTLALYGVTEN